MKLILLLIAMSLLPMTGGCKNSSPTASLGDAAVSTPAPDTKADAKADIRGLLKSGEGHRAVAASWTLLQEHPDDPDVQVLLASAYVMAERFEEGLREADKACDGPTASVGARLTRASALHGLKRTEEAVAELRTLLTQDPNHRGALSNLARYHGELAQWEAQAGVLTHLTSLMQEDASLFVDLAKAQLNAGKPKAAEAAAEQAVERAPFEAATHIALATILFTRDAFLETMDRLDIALRLQPEHPQAITLFQAAFYLAVAVDLQCAHGPGPWRKVQIDDALDRYRTEGLEGAEVWHRWHREHGQEADVRARLKAAALRCRNQR